MWDDRYVLGASDASYVQVDTSAFGGRWMRATANNDVGLWQTLKFIDLGGGNVAIQAFDGKYLSAEGGGGREITASRTAIGSWETFSMTVLNSQGDISLRASNGQYVCAEGGGGKELLANRAAVGPWETFQRRAPSRYSAGVALSIVAVGGGLLTASLDFGIGIQYLFKGNVNGLSTGAGGGWGQFDVDPLQLPKLGQCSFQFVASLAYITVGWQDSNGKPIGEAQCPSFVLPGGGAGTGTFS
jgi:hypothetical protein